MKTQPLKGMRDLLPREQALRDYIQEMCIRDSLHTQR